LPIPALFPPDRQARLHALAVKRITSKRKLNPPRRHRSYPRAVRRARHNYYRVKQPGETGTRYTGPATVDLVNLKPTPPTPQGHTTELVKLQLAA